MRGRKLRAASFLMLQLRAAALAAIIIASPALADEEVICREVRDWSQTSLVQCSMPTGRWLCDDRGSNCAPEMTTAAPDCGAVYMKVCLPKSKWVDGGLCLNCATLDGLK
jgi:hypothetical protein